MGALMILRPRHVLLITDSRGLTRRLHLRRAATGLSEASNYSAGAVGQGMGAGRGCSGAGSAPTATVDQLTTLAGGNLQWG